MVTKIHVIIDTLGITKEKKYFLALNRITYSFIITHFFLSCIQILLHLLCTWIFSGYRLF